MSLFFFVVGVVKLITSFRFAPQNTLNNFLLLEIQKRDTSVRAFVDTLDEMFARRKSSVVLLLLFSLVVLLSVSSFSGDGFTACFGFAQEQNETSLPASYRRALLQRARVCSNPWCFLISRRQRVKIRQCAVPQCARRVKPFSCSLEYCCASWCRNLPWEMLIQAPPPLSRLRDCVSTRVLRLV